MFVNNWLLYSKCLLWIVVVVDISWAILCYMHFLFSRFIMLEGVGKVIKTKGAQTKRILLTHIA